MRNLYDDWFGQTPNNLSHWTKVSKYWRIAGALYGDDWQEFSLRCVAQRAGKETGRYERPVELQIEFWLEATFQAEPPLLGVDIRLL